VTDIRTLHERLQEGTKRRYRGKTRYRHELVKQIEERTYAVAHRMGHEYATAEHLPKVLLDDPDAIALPVRRYPSAVSSDHTPPKWVSLR
jgi:hypothetical protein